MKTIVVAILLAICGTAYGCNPLRMNNYRNNDNNESIRDDAEQRNRIAGRVTDFVDEFVNPVRIEIEEDCEYEFAYYNLDNNQINDDFELDNVPVDLHSERDETLQYFEQVDVLVQAMQYFFEQEADSDSDEEQEATHKEEADSTCEEDDYSDEEEIVLYEHDSDTGEEDDNEEQSSDDELDDNNDHEDQCSDKNDEDEDKTESDTNEEIENEKHETEKMEKKTKRI